MNSLATGWYSELCPKLWPGQALSIEVESVVHQEESDFQKIEILDTKTYGRMLCLDGIIQLTERDEFAYQEMLGFVPICSHPNPKTVCVIGGGDGAILTRLCMVDSLEKIVLCELDIGVINCAKKYFPQFRRGFEDPRVEVITRDGAKYLQENENAFDVIITDSSDPIGPADTLFSTSYYETAHRALKEGGIAASQGESMWLHEELIVGMAKSCRTLFSHVDYGMISIPTYPSGQIGVLTCSKGRSCRSPATPIGEMVSAADLSSLRYYTPAIHAGCFALPRFLADRLE